MDVRCEHCRAHYVLDDQRITEAGLTVRCSTCGYTFRVKRKALFVTVPVGSDESGSGPVMTPSRQPAFTPAPEKREWRVRRANSEVFFTCRELTTLQKWIVERKVGRSDEISLSGSAAAWKRLGDIPELASFFQVVDAADRARAGSSDTLTPMSTPAAADTEATRQVAPGHSPPQPDRTGSAFDEGPVVNPGRPVSGGSSATKSPDKSPDQTWDTRSQVAAPLHTPVAEPAWAAAGELSTAIRQRAQRTRPPDVGGGAGKTIALFLALLVVAGAAAAVYFLRPEWLGLARVPGFQIPPGTEATPPATPVPGSAAAQPAAPTAPAAEAKPAPAPPSLEARPPPGPVAALPAEGKPPVGPSAPKTDGAPPPAAPLGETTAPATTVRPTVAVPAAEAKPAPVPPESPTAEARPPPPASPPTPAETKEQPAPAAAPEAPQPGPPANAAPAPSKEPTPPASAQQPATPAQATKEKPAAKTEPPKPESPAKRLRALLVQAKRLRDRGKSQEALTIYSQASELSPNSPDVSAGQGWCYLDLSQYGAAVKSFETALQRAPTHAEALMGLAETYRYEGRNTDAVKYYERYLAAHPDGEDATAAKNAVSQLKE